MATPRSLCPRTWTLVTNGLFQFFSYIVLNISNSELITLNKIHRFIRNFMSYKIIYRISFTTLRIFSPITRELYVKMANKVCHFIQNFMPYKMIYRLPHRFRFLSFRFHRLHETYSLMVTKFVILKCALMKC